MVGWVLASLAIAGLVAIGVAGMLAPRRAAGEYGIVLDDDRALGLIRAMAARDLVIGGLLALIAWAAARETLGWAMGATALIAVVDLGVVTTDRRATSRTRMDRIVALHGGGAVGLLAAGAVLLAGC
ncbi:MAG TPA: DUF4267 domain-containing protein [Candidatus Limnocylindria bacterium]|nr:DUF4267 domain-containing protein [Candidatus Limnocylindria bacterium]